MMIYEYSPFLNENRVLEIKVREAAGWVDQIHVCEADRNFSYEPKRSMYRPFFETSPEHAGLGARVHLHTLATEKLFCAPPKEQIYYNPEVHNKDHFDSWYWRLLRGNAAYHNESVQRNHATILKQTVRDEDIVILSDVDEILDSRFAKRLINEAKKHGIITVKLHYSAFYLNLFAASNHGMPHFAYRLFLMTGRYFKTMPFSPDYLRKRGIEGGFLNEIYCPDEPMGYHHSWLEPDKNALSKLKAFHKNVQDQSMINPEFASNCISQKRLRYLNAELYIDNDKDFLRALSEMDTSNLWFFE